MTFDISPLYISLKTAIISTLITFIIGIVFAWFMAGYNGKLKGWIDTILTLPLVLPPTVVGFFLLLIFGKNGYIGNFLIKLGIRIIFSWPATVIAATVVSFPLMYRTTRGAFEQIDLNILNAARTLGVSEYKVFFNVAIPLALPGIASGAILSFARAIGEFGATIMIAGNIPGKTQTIPLAIFFSAEGGDMGQALIWVILILWISIIVIVLTNNWTDSQRKNAFSPWRK